MNAVDTNVLIYACDSRDPAKQERALRLVEESRDCVLLWQVACEFVAASRKLGPQGFTSAHAWARLDEFVAIMPLVPPSPTALAIARKLHVERRASFWDAMLMGASIDAGVTQLHSEDLPGGEIEGLRVTNPFA